jgi:hypothetical protein
MKHSINIFVSSNSPKKEFMEKWLAKIFSTLFLILRDKNLRI